MTSEEFRRYPLLLRNQFDRNGTFEIPAIKKEEISLENLSLIGYDKLSSGKSDQIVHFFLDDYKFEVLWNNPRPRIEKLSGFRAVLSPQFSIYTEMPLAIQIHNTFRSRWCGAFLQSKGINEESKYIGTDAKGTRWYVQNLPDGSQLWVTVREGIIQNGGLNPMRRSWDDRTGLNAPRRKGEIENMGSLMKDKCAEDTMEGTLQGKAFMAMFELLDSIYSRKPYKNLAVVLSDISPNTWDDGMPADMACWEEICEFYDDLKNTYDSEFELAYQTCLRFLRQYEEEWDYPIPYAMEEFTCEKYREYYFKEA